MYLNLDSHIADPSIPLVEDPKYVRKRVGGPLGSYKDKNSTSTTADSVGLSR